MNFNLHIPTEIKFGSGNIQMLGAESKRFGSRALILTMSDIVKTGIVDKAIQSLKEEGIDYLLCDKVKPEPFCEDLDNIAKEIKSFAPDVVIGIGGGSVLDVSKAIAILVTNSGSSWDYIDLRGRPPKQLDNPNVPIIAVPTTSGTGAEVTMNSVLTNSSSKQKATIKFPSLFPKVAIIDPELTLTLPPHITGMTGFDAFTHALESYMNIARRSEFSDMIAMKSMKLSIDYLPQTIAKMDYLEGREKCAWSSVLAGLSIAHAGTTVAHAIGQPATARLGLPHGLAVSIFTIPVLNHTFKHEEDRFSKLADFLDPNGSKGLSNSEKAKHCIDVISAHQAKCGVDQTLSQNGADLSIIDELTEDTVGYMGRGLPQHPVSFEKSEIRDIITEAY